MQPKTTIIPVQGKSMLKAFIRFPFKKPVIIPETTPETTPED